MITYFSSPTTIQLKANCNEYFTILLSSHLSSQTSFFFPSSFLTTPHLTSRTKTTVKYCTYQRRTPSTPKPSKHPRTRHASPKQQCPTFQQELMSVCTSSVAPTHSRNDRALISTDHGDRSTSSRIEPSSPFDQVHQGEMLHNFFEFVLA